MLGTAESGVSVICRCRFRIDVLQDKNSLTAGYGDGSSMSEKLDTETDSENESGRTEVVEEPQTDARGFYDFLMQSYCWLAIFFILYVLSVGPFYRSWREAVDMGRRPLLQAVYLPLAGMCQQSETLNTVVEWYVGFWQG